VDKEGRGFGLADARYIVETLNCGRLRLAPSDRDGFSVMLKVKLATSYTSEGAKSRNTAVTEEVG
jgi:hypothetical protein